MARLLDGNDIARYIKRRHLETVRALAAKPTLAIIHASADPATDRYVRSKQLYADDIGVVLRVERPATTTQAIKQAVVNLCADPGVTGVTVQLPLPDRGGETEVLAAIKPSKDIDGLGPAASYDPATALGISWLLAGYGIETAGQRVAVVGQGMVGRSVAALLDRSGSQIVTADEHTPDLIAVTKPADIIVSATGRPGLITASMVKPGAVVIDAGISVVDDKVAGDATPELFERDDIAITPNPGGVGPMTVTALFDNLLRAAQADA